MPAGDDGDSWWPLSWLRGTYFPLSVVDVDTTARTAHSLVMRASTRITVELTEEQAREVGLPLGSGHQVCGMLLDAEGEPVELLRIDTLTVPLRWLHPVDMPVSTSHHDASIRQIP
ncbi:hypothetical protein ACFQLX_25340 [Streptomyces polyrhachis]|uniref:UTRA domain-containing protein n=1 Tax=Streptomyces polyrhachis TaxID=1282885 RepID=A0ABW2GLJ2_9ACTN